MLMGYRVVDLMWLDAVVNECSFVLTVLLGLLVEGNQLVAVFWKMVL